MRKVRGVKDFAGKVDLGGVKEGKGKIIMGAIPPQSLLMVGSVFTYGARKYARNNWMRGIAFSELYDALQRHLNRWWAGEFLDPESKLPHLAHAAWHCVVLLYFNLKASLYAQCDDRPFK